MKQRSAPSFWDDAFRREVEEHAVADGVLIWSFGGAAFAFRTPKSMIYIDPYFAGDPLQGVPGMYRSTSIPIDPSKVTRADAILITHEHYDHCQEETLEALARATKSAFYGPSSAVKEMNSYNLPKDRIKLVAEGDSFRVGDVAVEVFGGNDPNEPHAVTYLLESGGIRVFFTGDSFDCYAFEAVARDHPPHIAVLAFAREWYMNEAQLLDAAARLNPKLLLPCHWELWRGHSGDILEFGRLIERRKPQHETTVMLIGDFIHYRSDGSYVKGP